MRYRGYSIGFVLLGLYLILVGLQAFGVSFSGMEVVIAILAIAAGILILITR